MHGGLLMALPLHNRFKCSVYAGIILRNRAAVRYLTSMLPPSFRVAAKWKADIGSCFTRMFRATLSARRAGPPRQSLACDALLLAGQLPSWSSGTSELAYALCARGMQAVFLFGGGGFRVLRLKKCQEGVANASRGAAACGDVRVWRVVPALLGGRPRLVHFRDAAPRPR
jgi:hypothetical protein